MTLSSSEFIRRFLMHTLPSRFVRIRYFGFLANRLRKQRLDQCRILLGVRSAHHRTDDNGRITLNKIVDENPTTLAASEAKLNGRIWNTAALADDMMLVRDQDYIHALKFQGKKK